MDKADEINYLIDIPHFLFKIVGALTINFDSTTSFKILDLMKKDDQKILSVIWRTFNMKKRQWPVQPEHV